MPHSILNGRRPEYSYDTLSPISPISQGMTQSQIHSATSSRRSSFQTPIGGARQQIPSAVESQAYAQDQFDVDSLSRRRPGDRSSVNMSILNGSYGRYTDASKQRQPSTEEQQHYRPASITPAREKPQRDSPIIAELRTNVIVKDEFTLVTDLSHSLAKRYGRSNNMIMVKVDHSACLALGGNFDPCYVLNITAVASQMGPTMNRRNAALIQTFMAEILSVPVERGIIKFYPMPEENLAINGNTILGEYERQDKAMPADLRRTPTNMSRRSVATIRKASPPRLDLDFNFTANGQESDPIGDVSRAFDGYTGTALPASPHANHNAPQAVFELPTMDFEQRRPNTSHSNYRPDTDFTSPTGRANSMYNGSIGSTSRLANGRPKSFHGGHATHDASSVPRVPRINPANAANSLRSRPLSFLRGDPKPAAVSKPVISSPILISNPELSKRNSYIEANFGTSGKLMTIADLKSHAMDVGGGANGSYGQMPGPNISKRRASSISATPKMLSPPPPPPASDGASMRSGRLGKRKSFMAVLRRATASSGR